MAEKRVDGRHPATQRRVIDGVVVDERREVNQLQGRGEGDGLVFGLFSNLAREQEKSRAEQLAAHGEQVRAHLADERHIAGNDALHRLRYIVELIADRKLNRLECDSTRRRHVHSAWVLGCGRSHFVAALVICLRRLLTSRKSMSIANTRW